MYMCVCFQFQKSFGSKQCLLKTHSGQQLHGFEVGGPHGIVRTFLLINLAIMDGGTLKIGSSNMNLSQNPKLPTCHLSLFI